MNDVREAVITTITLNGGVPLPFVIPSEAEGSAVQSIGCNELGDNGEDNGTAYLSPEIVAMAERSKPGDGARSRCGLSSSSSSTTYAPTVPSENVTMIPSGASQATSRIRTSAVMKKNLQLAQQTVRADLLTPQSAGLDGIKWRF